MVMSDRGTFEMRKKAKAVTWLWSRPLWKKDFVKWGLNSMTLWKRHTNNVLHSVSRWSHGRSPLAWQWRVLWDEWCRMMTNVDDKCWQRSGSHQRVFQNVPRTESAATGKSRWLLILLSPAVRYAMVKCWSVYSIQILDTYWAMVINPLDGICIRITRLPLWEWWPQPIFEI
jgi:hypothetical protein